MASWDETEPGDSDIVSQFPQNERAARAAVETALAADHHEENDSDQGFHEKVTLLEQASDPTNAANKGILYTKDVGGITELFFIDSAGTVKQLTTNGALSIAAGAIGTTELADEAATNAKLAHMAQATIKGRAAGAGTGDATDLTAAQLVDIIETADGAGSGLDADLLDGQEGAFYRNAGNLNAGTLANARVAQSNVTQHEAALALNASQVTSTVKNEHGGFTVGSDDAGDVVEIDSSSARTVTVGSNALGGPGKMVAVLRRGTGSVTFSASGTTIRTKGGLAITQQHGAAVLIQLSSSEFQLVGDV